MHLGIKLCCELFNKSICQFSSIIWTNISFKKFSSYIGKWFLLEVFAYVCSQTDKKLELYFCTLTLGTCITYHGVKSIIMIKCVLKNRVKSCFDDMTDFEGP